MLLEENTMNTESFPPRPRLIYATVFTVSG